MNALVFTGAGGPEVMRLERRPTPVPGLGEVLIRSVFAGLNPADILQRAGRYPAPPGSPPDIPGLEVAGTVVSCGPHAELWRPGDRVFGIVGGGGLASEVIAHERHLAPVPGNLDDVHAAAVPEAFATAHDALFAQAGLQMGDVVVVTGANGGVGTAAVQLAVAAGACVLASVRDPQAAEMVRQLGAEPVSPDTFAERAKAAGGADIVLELVGAPTFQEDLEALATLGRIVVVSTAAGTDTNLSLAKLMSRRGRIMGTLLRARPIEQKAAVMRAFAHSVVPALADGRVRPLIDSVFPAEDAAAAFDRVQQSGKLGKVLLEFGD